MGIHTRESKWICTLLDDSRTCRASSSVMPRHDTTHRRAPTSVGVREQIDLLTRMLFNLGLAAGDFMLCLISRQSRKNQVVYAVSAETETVVSKLSHLQPIEEGLLTDPIRLAGPAIRSTAISCGKEDCGWKPKAAKHGCRKRVEITEAIVECQGNSSFRQRLSFCQCGDDFNQRRNPNIGPKPLHLFTKESRRDFQGRITLGNRMISQDYWTQGGAHQSNAIPRTRATCILDKVHCGQDPSISVEVSNITSGEKPNKNPTWKKRTAAAVLACCDFVVNRAENCANQKARHECVTKADDAAQESDSITGEKGGQ